jgi:molybdate transport repressor ModE-like protein
MMRLVPLITWSLVGESSEVLDARLLPLLNALAKSASLAAAVVECGISYRAAWGLLRDYQDKLGEPLVLLERGRGATLASLGQQIVLAQRTATRRLETILPGLGADLAAGKAAVRSPALHLRIAASHDLVLASLATGIAQLAPGLEFEPSFMGSLVALKEFAQGRADLAGFHVPLGQKVGWERAPFMRWLKPHTDRLIRFVDRDQGLILPRGNPAHVRNFRDIARHGLRFVNRQRGSGTRLLIDRIIEDAGLEPAELNGYASEEFTHAAVAATVASGGADAGFGLRAAAAEYELDFVVLVRERYYLAVRAKDLERPPVAKLVEVLQSPAFAQHARRFPGCNPADAGAVSGVSVLAADSHPA